MCIRDRLTYFAISTEWQILTFYDSLNVNSRIITPMPFFHRSYSEDAVASSCLNVATALLLVCVFGEPCKYGEPIKMQADS